MGLAAGGFWLSLVGDGLGLGDGEATAAGGAEVRAAAGLDVEVEVVFGADGFSVVCVEDCARAGGQTFVSTYKSATANKTR